MGEATPRGRRWPAGRDRLSTGPPPGIPPFDASVVAEIGDKLGSIRYAPEGHQVTVSVVDGVVTLDGSVRAEGDLPVVEGLARRVPGVVRVVSQVTFHEQIALRRASSCWPRAWT
ncbi:MAG: BON domain-containing protein [Acidimicrobiia bacterium]